jgi:hypothetical protein
MERLTLELGLGDDHNLMSQQNAEIHSKDRRAVRDDFTFFFFMSAAGQLGLNDSYQVANAYAMTSLVDLEEFVDPCSVQLAQKLEEVAKNSKTVELGVLLQYYALDVSDCLYSRLSIGF